MAKKCIKAVFSVLNLNKVNKKTFLLAFFMIIFSFLVSFQNSIPFQGAEEIISIVQAEEEEADPCDGNTTCGECGNCDPCTCGCSCDGDSSQGGGATYLENRDCHESIDCQCCSCSASCWWGCWYDMEWCGDGIQNNSEECDGNSPPPSVCLDNKAGNYDNDGMTNSAPYDGQILCDTCSWDYTDIDGGPLDKKTCWTNSPCAKGESQCDCSPADGRTCAWQGNCTAIDWCGDGNINGPEQFCDIHDATGTVDFGGQTCASKICSDIDPTDDEDKSLYSKNPNCLAEMAAYGGDLTCVNTCKHIYTIPKCEFPLNATGLDLSDDGQYVFVTDSSLWSLQMFPATTPESSVANPEKLIAIYYFDTEPLSVDIRGDYAYVGTKGEFLILNIDQLNKTDEYPDIDSTLPFKAKNPPLPFLEEQPPAIITIATSGEVNDVHIYGNYAYLAIGATGAVGPTAFEIVRIPNPAFPELPAALIGSYTFPDTINGVQSVDVELSGTYAYVSYDDGSAGAGYLGYFDISDKTNPILKKTINVSSSTKGIDILGNCAYIDGLSIFNSAFIGSPDDPSSVKVIDNLNLGVPSNETFAIDIDNLGNYAYVSVEEIGLRSVNLANPEILSHGEIITSPVITPVIVDIIIDDSGNYAYAAGLDSGLLIFALEQICGDGILNGFEVCDNPDLGGEDCANQGFAEGDLTCNPFCNAFDTSACIACGPTDGICPAGCTNPPDQDCPPCEGVICNSPGFCEIGPGVCENVPNVYNVGICVYPDDLDTCNTPGDCQIGRGTCDKSTGDCYYLDDPELCDSDGNVCTGDRCVSLDGGLTSNCMTGSNICGGIVPCGKMVNDPTTSWNDTDSCNLCFGVMVLDQGMDFLVTIASTIAILALVITGFLFITSTGNVERKNSAKAALKWVLIGFLILFLSWLIVDFLLSALGYLDPLGGKWNVVCE